jgi:uncharacterized membrane protein YebE (DUF533 family)
MNQQEHEAVFTLCLMAAFADGDKDDLERAELRRIAEGLNAADFNAAAAYQRVLVSRPTVAEVAGALATREARQLAYEMAVCVCDADGVQNAAEQRFLADLRTALQLAPAVTDPITRDADALAGAPAAGAAQALLPVEPVAATPTDTDEMILNYGASVISSWSGE